MDGRDPSNIPSLKKHPTTPKTHKKLRVKKMPDVMPALEQLFEKDGGTVYVPPPPREINETEVILKQTVQELAKKPGKRISEMI